jgi:uncharacterized membrane protein
MTTPTKEKHEDSELHQEFQLERMILFSDAVFAIVITLMAIEIQLPETHGLSLTTEEFSAGLKHVAPTLLAYAISFMFIGVIWHQHLKIFSLLKKFDSGLVVRNLILLFFVGLFPFAATVVARGPKDGIIPIMIYLTIILLCMAALTLIEHHILVKKPELRNDHPIDKFMDEYGKRKFSVSMFTAVVILTYTTDYFITNPVFKFMPPLWSLIMPIGIKIRQRALEKKKKVEQVKA